MSRFFTKLLTLRRAAAATAAGTVAASATIPDPPLPAHIDHDEIFADFSFSRWFIGALPQRAMSRLYGRAANVDLPDILRGPIYGLWANVFGSNLSEIEYPLNAYNTLSEFFCRPLRRDARVISDAEMVSPVDALLTVVGKVTRDGRLEQIKGVTYSLKSFLGFTPRLSKPTNDLYYLVLYLAPGDYHRIHSSSNWTIDKRVHYPGQMYPVNPKLLQWVPSLFSLNERIVLSGSWNHGFYSMSAVAAFNVGSMFLSFDESVVCNHHTHDLLGMETPSPYGHMDSSFTVEYGDGGIHAVPGQELARFQLGSTVVLVFESCDEDFEFLVKAGDRVQVGQALVRSRKNSKQNTIEHSHSKS